MSKCKTLIFGALVFSIYTYSTKLSMNGDASRMLLPHNHCQWNKSFVSPAGRFWDLSSTFQDGSPDSVACTLISGVEEKLNDGSEMMTPSETVWRMKWYLAEYRWGTPYYSNMMSCSTSEELTVYLNLVSESWLLRNAGNKILLKFVLRPS